MIKRDLCDSIERLAKKFPVLFITGPRQSGKTTLVKYVFPHYRYVNLEMLDERAAAREDPRFFLSIGTSQGMIVDEAQHVPELFSYIQGTVDDSREMGKFILTGSQNFLLLQKISQSLAGRAAVLHLHPFSFSELKRTSFRKTDLAETLLTGWYPPVYDRGIEPHDFYPAYITTYVERDVREITNISDLTLFQRFIRLCAGRTGQLLNYSGLANDIGVNYKTVQSWISILEASFIIFLLKPYYKNYRKRLVKSPKLYFLDTGLLCSLLDIETVEQLSTHYLRGGIFESFVISEYIKKKLHSASTPRVFFWRDNTGHEIDFLYETGGKTFAVEIKSGETINGDFFKGLAFYQKISGHGRDNCYLIYGGDRREERKYGKVLGWEHVDELPL